MAGKIELHETSDRYAAAFGPDNADGVPSYEKRIIALNGRSVEEDAAYLQRAGEMNVCILETRTTWRGKNGKRTKVELSRERVDPLICPLCTDPLLDRNDFMRAPLGETEPRHESCHRSKQDQMSGAYDKARAN